MFKRILVQVALALVYFLFAILMLLVSIALFDETAPNFFFAWALLLPAVVVLMGARQQESIASIMSLRWGLGFALTAALLWGAFLAAIFGGLSLNFWLESLSALIGPVMLPTAAILLLLRFAVGLGNRLRSDPDSRIVWPALSGWLPAAAITVGLGALLLIGFGLLLP